MPVAWGLGENVARIRKARNLSQEELAAGAGVAVDTVARIERGERQTTRTATLNKLARALGVEPSTLLGILPPHDRAAGDVTDLRGALTATQEVPGLGDFSDLHETVPLSELRSSLSYAWAAYIAGRHAELLHTLPVLLSDAHRLVHQAKGARLNSAYAVLSGAYRLGAGTAGRFGMDDLAFIAAERAVRTAGQSDDPDIGVAVSTRYLVWVLVRQGRTDEAESVAVRMAERVEPRMADRSHQGAGRVREPAVQRGIGGAARGTRRPVRRTAAGRAGGRRAIGQGRGQRGRASSVPGSPRSRASTSLCGSATRRRRCGWPSSVPDANGPVPTFWEAGHRIHLASAAVELRQERRALALLAEARTLAPDWVRYQPMGAAVMREIVDRATRRRNEEFAELAEHYGVVA